MICVIFLEDDLLRFREHVRNVNVVSTACFVDNCRFNGCYESGLNFGGNRLDYLTVMKVSFAIVLEVFKVAIFAQR